MNVTPHPDATTPRVACATLYDEGFSSIGWHARNTLTRYGHRHGHDVVMARRCDTDRPLPWHKLRLVEALFEEGYDYVFWMDADAMIVDARHDVADLADSRFNLHLVQHHLSCYPAPQPNTGVFFIRNCDWSRDLLEKVWSLEQYIHGVWWENAAFIHVLGRTDFVEQGVINTEGPLVDTTLIEWLSDRWNRLHEAVSPGSPIIRHYAGKKWRHRLRKMSALQNWPKAIAHETTRRPQPLDLSRYGVLGATLEHAAATTRAPESRRHAA